MTLELNSEEVSGGMPTEQIVASTNGTGSSVELPSILQAVLRPMVMGTAGILVMGQAGAAVFPTYGTSTIVSDVRQSSTGGELLGNVLSLGEAPQSVHLSAVEQIQEILAALSLNKSQLSSVLRVSRPTLYDWLRGTEPADSNAERLDLISGLLAKSGITSDVSLNARFVRRPVTSGGSSLLEVLSEDTVDLAEAESLMNTARDLTTEATNRRLSRDDRLRALGYDEPDDEERADRLSQNIAGMDWPTE